METKTILALIGMLLVGILIGYLFVPRSYPLGMHRMPNGTWMSNNSMMDDMMGRMMAELNGKTGNAFDKAFLSEMIVHHEGAVEMAQAALQYAKHQELKDLARAIIDAQTTEIAQMKAWQQSWYGN